VRSAWRNGTKRCESKRRWATPRDLRERLRWRKIAGCHPFHEVFSERRIDIMIDRRNPASHWVYPIRVVCSSFIATLILAFGMNHAIAAALAIEAVSNRADLVTGGELLVRVTLPPGVTKNKAVLSVNGYPLGERLHRAPDGNGFLALVSGMRIGRNTL